MSEHMLNYLNAYHDGELNKSQAQKVERHLQVCPSCNEAYQSILALSAELHEMPMPALPSAEKMAAEIALFLPRNQEPAVKDKIFKIGWWLIPIILLAIWILLFITNIFG
ncbi:MAG: zf-HC2 domain-containing protein, partial [Anaerolineaceae bacterium]|nr:zf-HC2 domain-containing protein [Anaerolineaceae bacterium]